MDVISAEEAKYSVHNQRVLTERKKIIKKREKKDSLAPSLKVLDRGEDGPRVLSVTDAS